MKNLVAPLLVAAIFQTADGFFSFLRRPLVHKPLSNLSDPLFISPYLEEGRIQDARDAAEVHLDIFQNVTSYTGYLTVDKETSSNLFFWFFPSANNYADDPVILWLQGGPGASSLLGLYVLNGPFLVEPNGNVSLREFSWHKNHSVLYIDQPVGSGYSFTNGSYLTDQNQVANHLYDFLLQFFTLFPELQKNNFYIVGESYAGKYVPAIGYAIYQRNSNASFEINLQGLLIGNGVSDPIHQTKYGDLLYQLGLIDLNVLDDVHQAEENILKYIKLEMYFVAAYYTSLLNNMILDNTGLATAFNFLKYSDDTPTEWQNFTIRDDVREAIHVGSQTYQYINYAANLAMAADISKSVAPWIVELLNHYRILIYNGQLDVDVSYSATVNYIQHLNFSAAEEYKTAKRGIWRIGEKVAGYVKTAGNLTEVMVRNAGHMVPYDQPEAAYDLIYNFIRNQPLVIN